jgi:hypothetical protein
MPDYFTQFSEVFDHLTADEEAWLRQQLTHIYVFGEKEYADGELPESLKPDEADWSGYRLWRGAGASDPDYLSFDYEFDEDDRWGRHLWVYAMDFGEPARVVELARKFLKRFRPDQCWELTFASACSNPGVGDFGGGAVFVTADEIRRNSAYDFIEQQRRLFDSRHGKPQGAENGDMEHGHHSKKGGPT